MSTAYAFAAVTVVLRSQLTAYFGASQVSSSVGGLSFSALPPDRIQTGTQEANGLNLFLHRVTRNPGWANLGPPPRDSAGNDVAAPPLAVDLHYVVSAYGQNPLVAEILLGHAVACFHEQPVVPRAAIRRALAPNPPDPLLPAAVGTSRLAEQFEQLRLTSANPGAEEVARMWSSFSCPYRPSAFFSVSVVLVDPLRGANAPFPVRAVTASSTDLDQPEVDEIRADGPPGSPIVAGAVLVISGRNLSSPNTTVRIGPAMATPTSMTARELRVPLAAFDRPVPAGLSGLVVAQQLDLGDPPTPHAAATSAAVPFTYRPTVSVPGNGVTIDSTRTVDGVPLVTGSLTTTVAPRVGRAQQAVLLLSEAGAPVGRAARGSSLRAPADNGVGPGNDDTDSVTFGFRDVPKGTYVLRLSVDGVESPVGVDGQGRYASPSVVL